MNHLNWVGKMWPDTVGKKLTSDLWVSQMAATQRSTDDDPCDEIIKLLHRTKERTAVHHHLACYPLSLIWFGSSLSDPTLKIMHHRLQVMTALKEAAGGFSHLRRITELFLSGSSETTLGVEIRSHRAIFVVTNKMWHSGIRVVSSQRA